MSKKLSEMTLEELWQLFPIFLTEPQPCWKAWYAEEADALKKALPMTALLHHVGSTSVGSIWAKPIIDIMVKAPTEEDLPGYEAMILKSGYRCMSREGNRLSYNKGYTEAGFTQRVFHLHLRVRGDNDELYFRDYLKEHSHVAGQYESLKLNLWKQYEHDRDGYTNAKTAFISKYTQQAKALYKNRYEQTEMSAHDK